MMTIREQFQRMVSNTNRGLRFVEELNAIIELKVYANGNEEKALAIEMMREHLASFDICKMDVSERNYQTIKRLQKEYGVA